MIKILFVCMGNICRSPTADGVFRHRLAADGLDDRVQVDSAGTHGWHVGNPPDPRSVSAARARGIDISDVRSRKVRPADFTEFDYVLAMDQDNLDDMGPSAAQGTARVHLFLEFASHMGETDVPDPYYGGDHGFDHVLDLVEAASDGLIAHLRATHF
jgi:protein-tyrosine phosphatase